MVVVGVRVRGLGPVQTRLTSKCVCRIPLVLVSHTTSSCWMRRESVPAMPMIGQHKKLGPGERILSKFPQRSEIATFC